MAIKQTREAAKTPEALPEVNFSEFDGGHARPGELVFVAGLNTICKQSQKETGVTGVYLEQLYTFGKPDRDPRERIISVTYYALAPSEILSPVAVSSSRFIPS